jgi:hypothetical protein
MTTHKTHDVLIPVTGAPEEVIGIICHFHGERDKLGFRLPLRLWTAFPFGKDGLKSFFFVHGSILEAE